MGAEVQVVSVGGVAQKYACQKWRLKRISALSYESVHQVRILEQLLNGFGCSCVRQCFGIFNVERSLCFGYLKDKPEGPLLQMCVM